MNIMKRTVQFFRDSSSEMKKVVWPSRDEVSSSTKVVLVSITIFAVLLGILDFIFANIIELFF